MYLWDLVGRDTTEESPRSGIGGGLGNVMRTVEAEMTKFPGFDGRVAEVVQRLSVVNLDTIHVRTGREWLACRDEGGAVYWKASYRRADPAAACDLTALDEVSTVS